MDRWGYTNEDGNQEALADNVKLPDSGTVLFYRDGLLILAIKEWKDLYLIESDVPANV